MRLTFSVPCTIEGLKLFYGLVAHDLKSPLTSIIGYTELLLESDSEQLPPEVKGIARANPGFQRRSSQGD
jgi:signal transduction histidine kinase